MAGDDQIREILIEARKRLDADRIRYADGSDEPGWREKVTYHVQASVARARELIKEHQAELGKHVTLFESTRISKLLKDLDALLQSAPLEGVRAMPKNRGRRGASSTPRERRLKRKPATPPPKPVPAIAKKEPLLSSAHGLDGRDVTLSMLGPGVKAEGRDEGDGIYCRVLDNGAVAGVRAVKNGKVMAELRLWPGKPRGQYEDSANVEEYDAGRLESYGGRYHHEVQTELSLEQWVKEKVRLMERDWFE